MVCVCEKIYAHDNRNVVIKIHPSYGIEIKFIFVIAGIFMTETILKLILADFRYN